MNPIPKDHRGLYLAPPFNQGKQVKIIPDKDAMSKHYWKVLGVKTI